LQSGAGLPDFSWNNRLKNNIRNKIPNITKYVVIKYQMTKIYTKFINLKLSKINIPKCGTFCMKNHLATLERSAKDKLSAVVFRPLFLAAYANACMKYSVQF
jgi:hypothetical protein